MSARLIVSRHPAAIAFIREADSRFADAPVVAQATADDVAGMHVAGNIPLHLAVLASSVTAVEFAGSAPRGAEYSLDEMHAAGARLATYIVCDGGASARVAALVESESHVWAARDAVRAMRSPKGWEVAPAGLDYEAPVSRADVACPECGTLADGNVCGPCAAEADAIFEAELCEACGADVLRNDPHGPGCPADECEACGHAGGREATATGCCECGCHFPQEA